MKDSTFILQKGMRINYLGDNVTVLAIGDNFSVIQYENGDVGYPLPMELMSAYRNGLLIIKKSENAVLMNKQLTKQEDKEKALRVEHFLVELHQHANPHSNPTREKVIKIIAKRHKYSGKEVPSPSTLRRWYIAWLDNEMDIYPVIKQPKKPRAKRHSEKMIELAEQVMDDYFLVANGLSRRQTYFKYVEIAEEHLGQEGWGNKLISESRFYEMINELNQLDVVYARHGKDEARKFANSSEGKYVLDFPLQRVEFDAIHLKVGLLDDETGEFLGTVIVYLAIDCYTRCIVGYSISYGKKPSEVSDAVIELLKHCVSPKVKSPLAENDWPLTGIPFSIYGDAGSAFKCRAVTSFMAQIKTNHITTETRSPWRKGMSEAFNGTLRKQMASTLPGYTRNNEEHKTDKSIEEIATLTLGEFIACLEVYILDHYHQNPHKGLFLNSPANVCREAMKTCPPPRVVSDLSKLDSFGGFEMTGTIQGGQGIQRKNLYYSSPDLNKLRLKLSKLGEKSNPKVPFLYNKNDVSKISVIDETTGCLLEVPCTDPRVSPDMSLKEFNHKYRSGTKVTRTRVFSHDNPVVSEAMKRKLAEILLAKREAAKKKQEAKAKSKSSKKSGSNDKSLAERASEQVNTEAGRFAKNHTGKPVKKSSTNRARRTHTRPVTE